ncbi:MAG TPA: flavodoxin family protein, partial [candidate division Zixibacteria bacterium]|nr:flavodoxin family protein [candidate division Zixibacteria bacterium]
MIKVLALSGSPVENSSTDILLKIIADSLGNSLSPHQEVETSFVKLNEKQIKPCQACGESPSPKFCFYDDINDIYTKIAECDCLLFGSPVYFDTVSAQAKLLI